MKKKISWMSFVVKGFVLINLLITYFSNELSYSFNKLFFDLMGYSIFGENEIISLILFLLVLLISLAMILTVLIKPSAKFKVYLYVFLAIACIVDVALSLADFIKMEFTSLTLEFLLGAVADIVLLLLMAIDLKLFKPKAKKNVDA